MEVLKEGELDINPRIFREYDIRGIAETELPALLPIDLTGVGFFDTIGRKSG